MRIELQWAFVEEDMVKQPCALCELAFESKAVIIRSGTYGYEVCEECLRALSGRKEADARAPWPAWEEYEALAAAHPEPMFESPEAMAASETAAGRLEAGEWPAYEASWLWTPPEAEPEEDIHITPTVIYRAQRGTLQAVVAEGEDGRALIVFRSEEEAERYRLATGNYPEAEGFKPVWVDHKDLANILEMHECTHVAMREPWTGDNGVDFFEAEVFTAMLEESVSA